MIDTSDGLLADLAHICLESGVGADLNRRDLPISKTLRETATQYKKDPYQLKEVLQAVFPRKDYDPSKMDKGNRPGQVIRGIVCIDTKRDRLIKKLPNPVVNNIKRD